MNGRAVVPLLTGLVVACTLTACGTSPDPAEGVNGAPPELRKGVKVRFAQTASIGSSELYKEEGSFFNAPVGEVEEVRGPWVRMKLRLNKGDVVHQVWLKEGLVKEEEITWVNFNTVGQYRVIGKK